MNHHNISYPFPNNYYETLQAENAPTISEWLVDGTINATYYPNLLQTDTCYEEQTQAVRISLAITKQVESLINKKRDSASLG